MTLQELLDDLNQYKENLIGSKDYEVYLAVRGGFSGMYKVPDRLGKANAVYVNYQDETIRIWS